MQPTARLRPPHPRIVATFVLLPIIVGLEFPLFLLGDKLYARISTLAAFTPAMLFPAVALHVGCLVIWRNTIAWTPGRRVGVPAIAAVSAVLILSAELVATALGVQARTLLVMLPIAGLAVTGIALWITALVCCDPVEPTQVDCPSCGYDLRGQRECRCPECGAEYTLGDLARPREG